MYLPAFEYVRPADVAEALEILNDRGDDAAVYMGGTELLLLMKLGLAAPGFLVDCKRMDGLGDISLEGPNLHIGAAITHRQIEHSDVVNDVLPSLSRLAAHIGNVRVRSVGTLGGNLCFADPHSDPATLLIALDASVRVVSSAGSREVACADFVTSQYETDLREGELLVEVTVPIPAEGARVSYERIGFRERPIVNVAIVRTGAGTRVVVGGGGRCAKRVAEVESRLDESGWQSGDRDPITAAAAEDAARALDPTEDLDGSAAYKRQLVRVAFHRAVKHVLG